MQRKTLHLWSFGEAGALIPTESNRRNDSNAVLDAVNRLGGINVGLSLRANVVMVQGDFLIVSATTDREGKFQFSNLEHGTYTVEATYFGFYAKQKITVEAGAVVQVALQLKLPDLKAPPES